MINISVVALIGYLMLAAYIGIVIGEVKTAIVAQKELNKQKELTNEFAKIVAELTVNLQNYIGNNSKVEDANGTADKDNE